MCSSDLDGGHQEQRDDLGLGERDQVLRERHVAHAWCARGIDRWYRRGSGGLRHARGPVLAGATPVPQNDPHPTLEAEPPSPKHE